jgi:GH15 family glucan-1,4-alpha-glucosidase
MTTTTIPPISEYAMLSDCRTAALVAPDSTIEWLCAPRFDSPSVFARLLDRHHGGAWEWTVPEATTVHRDYLAETLVLRTRWHTPNGTAVGHDFLAVVPRHASGIAPAGILVRLLHCERGTVRLQSRITARPDYSTRDAHWTSRSHALIDEHSGLLLSGPAETIPDRSGAVVTDMVLRAGESVALGLDYTGDMLRRVDATTAHHLLTQTTHTWQAWASRSDYQGVAADWVRHSAVVLKGLISDDSGALITAPTTSLSEWPGGARNWDYRYAWRRDTARTIRALLRLGHHNDAGQLLRFLLDYCAEKENRVPPVTRIDNTPLPNETTLTHLSGYHDSRPVRIHSDAYRQHQLDVYGHILEAAFAYHEATGHTSLTDLNELRKVVEIAGRLWRHPDAGVWGINTSPRHWTESKLYAWVCFDRAIRLFQQTGTVPADTLDQWQAERDAIRTDVIAKGCHAGLGRFVQTYGAANVDGSLLHIPLVDFLPGTDPRVVATIDRIDAELGEAGFLVHRYDASTTRDDVPDTGEGAFLPCSFDMVSALVLANLVDEAHHRFTTLCAHAGALRLFAEEMTADGTMLGNYPHAFTHLALIEAALHLDEAQRERAHRVEARRPA